MDQLGRNPERKKRAPILWQARLRDDFKEWPCQVFDMNLEGAKVRIAEEVEIGAMVKLDIPHIAVFKGKVTWCKPGQLGVKFTMDENEVRMWLGKWVGKLGLDA